MLVLASIFKDDAERMLEQRLDHLLSKGGPGYVKDVRWLWGVGDSTDATEAILKRRAVQAIDDGRDVQIVDCTTGLTASNPHERLIRLSATWNRVMDAGLRDTDTHVIWHESDLVSPPDVVERLLALGDCGGGWPMLRLPNGVWCFYDTWAYRAHGMCFSNDYPFHPVWTDRHPFEVDAVGSVYLYPAREVRGPDAIRMTDMVCVELYHHLRKRGYTVKVDPRLMILQPTELWRSINGFDRPLEEA